MRNSIDMINGSFGKNIFRFALPLVLMSMLQILFAACDDMVILGLFVSTDALAAVGATTYIVNLFRTSHTTVSLRTARQTTTSRNRFR